MTRLAQKSRAASFLFFLIMLVSNASFGDQDLQTLMCEQMKTDPYKSCNDTGLGGEMLKFKKESEYTERDKQWVQWTHENPRPKDPCCELQMDQEKWFRCSGSGPRNLQLPTEKAEFDGWQKKINECQVSAAARAHNEEMKTWLKKNAEFRKQHPDPFLAPK